MFFRKKTHACTSRNVIYMQNLEKNTVGFEFNKVNKCFRHEYDPKNVSFL